jgi:hypothetical protein
VTRLLSKMVKDGLVAKKGYGKFVIDQGVDLA